jgi:hypothetical protein
MMHRNNKDGSYNVRGYGGARDGAGRPTTGRKRKTMYITDAEYEAITALLDRLRNEEGSHPIE